LYARAGIDPNKCVYCGNRRTDTDHLYSIVKDGQPSGYFHVAGNLVPACGPCNQSKSGLHWRTWMTSAAPGSPATRQIADLALRIQRLERFEALAGLAEPASTEELKQAVGPDVWEAYWKTRDA